MVERVCARSERFVFTAYDRRYLRLPSVKCIRDFDSIDLSHSVIAVNCNLGLSRNLRSHVCH